MKKLGFIAVFFLLIFPEVFSQGEIDEQQKLFFRNERTFGITLYSTGYGGSYRYGKRINFFNQKLYEIGLNVIKHPKEVRTSNPWFQDSKRFVFGKENVFFNLHVGLGFQRIKYKKVDKGGIAVRFLYAGGLSLGILKPVYYEVLTPVSLYEYTLTTEKFNAALHKPTDIYGRASFFKGFGEIQVVPGLYGRVGVNFEFGKRDPLVSAIEIGVTLDAYYKKVRIMASDDNKQFFPAIYASFRFGKIVDPRSEAALNFQGNQGPVPR